MAAEGAVARVRPPQWWRDFILRHWLLAFVMFGLLLVGVVVKQPWLIDLATVALLLLGLRMVIFFSPFAPFFHGWLFRLFGPAVDGLPLWLTGSPHWPDLRGYFRRP